MASSWFTAAPAAATTSWFTSTSSTGGVYVGTSTTLSVVELGTKTFVTQEGLAYIEGTTRVRVSSKDYPTLYWMEGVVSSYSSTTMVVNVDRTKGDSTTIDAWDINMSSGSNMFSGYDVFLLAGQSNMVGWQASMGDVILDYPDSRIMQWGSSISPYLNKVLIAKDTLKWPLLQDGMTPEADSVCCGLTFAKLYADTISLDRKILLVPAASGGTGLVTGGTGLWSVGGTYYENAVTLANAAMASNSDNRFMGILWCQGETDAMAGVSQSTYATALDTMIDGFRTSITGASTSPFVLIGMVPEWISGVANNIAINAAHAATPSRKYYTAFTSGPSGNNIGGGTNIHYTSAGQRLIGVLAYSAYLTSLQNSPTKVATPSISLGSGSYYGTQTVTVTTATSGATIRYTTNGATPGASSTLYGGAITISASSTLKVIAVKASYTNSEISSAAYTIITQAATPTFSVGTGTYTSTQSVTLSCATSGVSLYYTTDGSTPSSSSSLYSTAVSIASTTTLKVIAVKSGLTDSAVATAVYTIAVLTPTFSPDAGTYSSTQSVTLSCATSGASIYYTVDGSTPSISSTLYSSTISVAATTTVKAIGIKSGLTSSAVASAVYTIAVLTPTFSPDAGTYSSTQSVTLSCATAGASIYYTIDGSTPSASSTLYSTAISVAATTTVKAIGIKSGLTSSAVASALYTINVGGSFDWVLPSLVMDQGISGYQYTIKSRLAASTLTKPTGSPTQFRIEVYGGITSAYLGPKAASGDPYDASSLTQFTFGGSQGLANTGVKTLSDAVNMTWDKTSDLIISIFYTTSNSTGGCDGIPYVTATYYAGGASQAGTANVTGFSDLGQRRTVAVTGIQCNGF